MSETITSARNPLILRLRKLKRGRSTRREEGVFLCEGPKMLGEALRWGAALETVVYAAGTALPPLPPDVRVVEVPGRLLGAIADTETPQGAVFLCRGRPLALPERLEGERFLVLDGVQDPGNVGTVWRSADAFGADALLLCNACADPWSPKTVRATMGAVFRLPVYECALPELAERLRARGVPLYAAALGEDTVDVRDVCLARSAVVIGSEGRGVSDEALSLCAGRLKIPMRARCESLNAAAAAAVLLWEMYRGDGRRETGPRGGTEGTNQGAAPSGRVQGKAPSRGVNI